ncbi:putative amidase AmiB2 [Nocardioides deserti]|nr:putative amidase AmiB2 [Nocardioides deserti]
MLPRRRSRASTPRLRGVDDLTTAGVAETVRLTTSGETTARAVVDAALARIAAHDGALNAVSQLVADRARSDADRLDAARAGGAVPGPLHGVPVVIKEELAVEGLVTTFGGEANSTPAADDAEVVRRLRVAGAVVVATTTMPEFGAWPYTESSSRGYTRNPWDRTRTPGGSSGGTAAAVASGMVPVGLGGDGGGSIRIPSAHCGLFGLKPQRGRVTSAPHDHLWFALGTAGPLARSVLDSALVYDVVRGHTDGDRWRAGSSGSFADAARREPGRLRIGWTTKPVTLGVRPDPVHVRAVQDTARLLADLGHDVREVDPRYPDPTAAFVPQFLGGIRAEAAAVQHPDRLERRTRETCRLGAWVTPTVLDKALALTEKVSEKANRVFDRVDVLLTPAVAHRPARVGVIDGKGTVRSALAAMPAIAYAALWNVAGNPAAAVPCGPAADGLPVAVQLVGRTDDEATLLSLSAQLEAARPWPLVAPVYDPSTGAAVA